MSDHPRSPAEHAARLAAQRAAHDLAQQATPQRAQPPGPAQATSPQSAAPAPAAPAQPASFRYKDSSDHLDNLLAISHALEARQERMERDARAAERAPRLAVTLAADITAQPIEWLWPNRFALGKVSLVAGVPGLGKSQLAAFLAAAVTAGRPLPCGEGQAPDGEVVILSAEDDAVDTIRPRLDAAGADPDRVYIVSSVHQDGGRRAFNLQADLALLEDAIDRSDTRLVIIDPISSYLGRVDSHKNAEVRSVLEPLAEMAARRRVAVLAITHFSKGASARAMDRVVGSIAFVAAARSAFMIARDPNDAERRLFVPIKSNVAAEGSGLAFRVTGALAGNVPTSVVVWETERVGQTADTILTGLREAEAGVSARMEAEEFLRKLLANGEVPATEVRAATLAAGISWASMRRTQKAIGVRIRREARDLEDATKGGQWIWSLLPRELGNAD